MISWLVESVVTLAGPDKLLILLQELVERLENGTQVMDEFAMVVDHAEKSSESS